MRCLPSLAVLFLLVVPTPAVADVREGRVSDPRDGRLHENVDGSSYRETDIELVAARYDTAGSVQFHLRLYEPFADRDSLPSFQVCAFAPEGAYERAQPNCSYFGARGDLTFSGSYGSRSEPHFTLEGYEGTIPAAVNFSDDGRSVFIDGNHPALANRAYTAAGSVVYESDSADGFHLYGPGAFAHCSDGLDNDGDDTIDGDDDGCDAAMDGDERLTQTPRMTRSQALRYLKTALTREFRATFRYRSGWSRACTRTTPIRFTCRVSWGIGDASYRGVARLWHSRDGELALWNYAWRIVETDEYCKYVLRRKRCTRTYVVH